MKKYIFEYQVIFTLIMVTVFAIIGCSNRQTVNNEASPNTVVEVEPSVVPVSEADMVPHVDNEKKNSALGDQSVRNIANDNVVGHDVATVSVANGSHDQEVQPKSDTPTIVDSQPTVNVPVKHHKKKQLAHVVTSETTPSHLEQPSVLEQSRVKLDQPMAKQQPEVMNAPVSLSPPLVTSLHEVPSPPKASAIQTAGSESDLSKEVAETLEEPFYKKKVVIASTLLLGLIGLRTVLLNRGKKV